MMTTPSSPLSTGTTADLGGPPDATSPPGASTHVKQQPAEEENGDGSSEHVEDYQNLIEEVIFPDYCINEIQDDGKTPLLHDYYKGPLFTLKGMPGFYYAPQALSKCLQRALGFAAVSRYCEPPHVTNMDSSNSSQAVETETGNDHQSEPLLPSLWDSWRRDAREIQKGTGSSTKGKSNKTKTQHSTAAAATRNSKRSFQKLSWSTMGYHYDWNARSYNENVKSNMPFEIEQLAQLFATTALLLEREINQQQQQHQKEQPSNTSAATLDDVSSPSPSSLLSYTASGCIVNYYNPKSLMGGHRDDLEMALDKPLISLSLGRPAIFLLGGHCKDDGPVIPIWVRPGDVMILGGNSRVRYHGMARLLPLSACARISSSTCTCNENDTPYQVTIADVIPLDKMEESKQATTSAVTVNNISFPSLQDDEDEIAMVDQFLTENRINLSVRQVYH
jgi:alkylated DNA repair protein alkB family protein 1